MEKMINALWAGFGGFAGAAARYLIAAAFPAEASGGFPIGTLLVNIAGSFALGAISESAIKFSALKPETIIFLAIGFCGGLTTFSAFMYDNYSLLKQTKIFSAAAYGAASYVFSFAALYAGMLIVRKLFD